MGVSTLTETTYKVNGGERLSLHSIEIRFELQRIESSLLWSMSEKEKDVLLSRTDELVTQAEYLRNAIRGGIREVTK